MDFSAGRRFASATVVSIALAAACSVLALFVLSGNLGGAVATAMAAGVVYMIPLTSIQAATDKPLASWLAAARFPYDWVVFTGAELLIGLASAAIGSSLMLLLGLVRSWDDLYLANRMVVVFSVLVACAVRVYNTTNVRLEERNRQLEDRVTAEGRVLELHQQDFERAREIQEALMPKKLPDMKRCRLAAGCQPARMVGGDYYDAIRLDDSILAVAIADVCGKGMGAALLMSNLQAIVRGFASREIAPAALCAKANRLIGANVAPGKYVTFFYAIVDLTSMAIVYCNAGHNPPMLVRPDGTIRRLDEGGPVLGIFPDAGYVAGAAELRAGDRILMFTDGVTEAMNATDEEFGEERLMALLGIDDANPAACRDQIMAAVTQFSSNGLHDDATLLIVQVN